MSNTTSKSKNLGVDTRPIELDLLRSIDRQLKIMNVHLSIITDEELNETDIGNEVI